MNSSMGNFEGFSDSQLSNSTVLSVEKKTVKSKEHIKVEQKELMINYIFDNPEILTHSRTKRNDELWIHLVMKLNKLKPEKSTNNWKNFLQRWQIKVFSKSVAALTNLDLRLKSFLDAIKDKSENIGNNNSRKRCTVKELENTLKEIEMERAKLQLQVDENDFKIEQNRQSIKRYEQQNIEKRKRIQKINLKKKHLHKRKREIIDKREVNDSDSSEATIRNEEKSK